MSVCIYVIADEVSVDNIKCAKPEMSTQRKIMLIIMHSSCTATLAHLPEHEFRILVFFSHVTIQLRKESETY